MKVLLINYELPPLGGGAGKATKHLAKELVRLGHEVYVLTSAFKGLPAREALDGYTVERIPTIRRRSDRCSTAEMGCFALAAVAVAVKHGLWGFRPQVTCAFFGLPSGPAAAALKLMCGTPYVVSLRGGDVPGFQPYDLAGYHALARPAIRAIWRGASAVVANSRGLKLLAETSARGRPIELIPNGVESPAGPIEPRRTAGAKVVFTGRLVEQKGLAYLMPAFAQVCAAIPSAELELLGDGPLRARLEAEAESLGIGDRLTISGWLPHAEVLRRLRGAQVFALPSLDEGMSNALLEALACGLPAVATAISGNEELVEPGRNGFLVPPRDPRLLAEKLRAILADQDLAARMAGHSREVAERYTWPAAAQAYVGLFQQALSPDAAPVPKLGSAAA